MAYFIIGILYIISMILYLACIISSECHDFVKEKEEYNVTKK